jgi:large subunit ribosomal protein L24
MRKIRKNDLVQIMKGKDAGKSGRILAIFPAEAKCIVEGSNRVKRHQKARQSGAPSGIIEKSMRIHLSNVMLIDPKNGKPSRVKFLNEAGKKVRVFTRSGARVEAVEAGAKAGS